jgi:hypothetical protein
MKVFAHMGAIWVAAHLVGLGLASAPVSAQTVWRCGPAGNQFSQQPCADGRAVATPAPPSSDTVNQAREVSAREQALAQGMQQERLAREAAQRSGAIDLTPSADEAHRRRVHHAKAAKAHKAAEAAKAASAVHASPTSAVKARPPAPAASASFGVLAVKPS